MRKQEQKSPDVREVEWQFDASDLRVVERWLKDRSSGGEISVSDGQTRRISDTYLDTRDWRLYRAGFALRLRQRGRQVEATMKSLEATSGKTGLRERREISEPIQEAAANSVLEASGPVGERVRILAGSNDLTPIFRIRTRRDAYALTSEGETIGEIALDDTEIPLGGGRKPANLRRVEIEAGDAAGSLEEFVEELRANFDLAPAGPSKFEAAMRARGLEPSGTPDFGPGEVEDSMSVGEVAFAVMGGQFEKFLAHEPGTRLGEDPEELHDMRVASRRLRAAMKIFEDALPARSRALQDELKHFAGVLGEVRDLDVQLEQLRGWIHSAEPEDREALGTLVSVLENRRVKARKKMLRSLDSKRYERFVDSFERFLRRGPHSRSNAANEPVLAAAPDIIRRRYRKVRKAGDAIGKKSSAEEYHELRKRGKRFRYALEFLSGVYGKPADKLIGQMKDLQDVLGDHQDAVVAVEHLRELSESGELSQRAVFTMGGISRRYQDQARELRARFPKVYDGLKGKGWKKLEKKMDKRRPKASKPDAGANGKANGKVDVAAKSGKS